MECADWHSKGGKNSKLIHVWKVLGN